MPKRTISISPQLAALEAEAEAMGVSFPALLTTDIVRYRQMADSAAPDPSGRRGGGKDYPDPSASRTGRAGRDRPGKQSGPEGASPPLRPMTRANEWRP